MNRLKNRAKEQFGGSLQEEVGWEHVQGTEYLHSLECFLSFFSFFLL